MIRITAKKDGFRRAGVAHPKVAVEYPDDRFSKEELEALRAEPQLVVGILEEKKSTPPTRPNVPNTVKLVEAAETAEVLDELAKDEDRKGVTDAIAKRRDELTENK